MCVYWPRTEADMMDYIKRCLTCIKCSNLPIETLHPHEVPPGPWVKIGVDFFQDHLGKKTPDCCRLLQQAPIHVPSGKTINHLRELFASEGVSAIVMSNSGPPFNGDDFKKFAHEFDFAFSSIQWIH